MICVNSVFYMNFSVLPIFYIIQYLGTNILLSGHGYWIWIIGFGLGACVYLYIQAPNLLTNVCNHEHCVQIIRIWISDKGRELDIIKFDKCYIYNDYIRIPRNTLLQLTKKTIVC